MRFVSPVLVGCSLAWAVSADAQGPSWKWTPEAVVDTVAAGNVVLSPDGRTVVFTRSRWRDADAKPGPGHVNLWRVAFDGGEPARLTYADAEDQRPRFSPDGARLAFLSRRGEGAKTRVWVLPASGPGEPEAVSDEKVDVSAFEWAPDGRALAYVAADAKPEAREKAEKAGRDEIVVDADLRPRRLWILDLATRKAERVAPLGDLSAWDVAWAPDGEALVATVTDRNRTDDSYMFKRVVVLPRDGERRELVGVVGKVGEVAWSPDGRTIAWRAGVDASDPSIGSVFVVPAAGGAPRNLTADRTETASAVAWRRDGRLAVTTVTGTRTVEWIVDAERSAWTAVLGPAPVVFSAVSWSADTTRFALLGSSASHPPDVLVGALAAAPAAKGAARGARVAAGMPALRRVADANPGLDALPRGSVETFKYKAADGLDLEAILIRPTGFTEGPRYPLVVFAHGGPESQYDEGWINSYSAPGHALAERGYLVFAPNYRGSTGRGVAFAKSDHRDLGGKEFTDVLDGIDALVVRGWVDPARVAMNGGSYGGYFTALAVTRHSERFAAGVEWFGITNWESFLGQSDIPIENAIVHWDLWCYEHAALCRERSPVTHIAKARTPTLILQGADDPRVPRPQSDELHAALVWKKVPVEYVVYPREPHGFRERAHRLDALTRTLAWIDKHMAAR